MNALQFQKKLLSMQENMMNFALMLSPQIGMTPRI